MKRYLLSIFHPDGPPPPAPVLDKIMRDVAQVRSDMQTAGVWVFAGGLCPPSTATVLRQRDGQLLTFDGPFAEGKEHLGGFTIIEAPDLDAALAWGRRLALAVTLPVEVRPFQDERPS
ncbi:MAG: hypothetical protein IPK26_10740 [Planctomycetes bacterium]|nr:hypothetical protein [Planctomycetota bacterium]